METIVSHTRKNYYRFVNNFKEWLSETKGKSLEEIKPEDTHEYKAYCQERFTVNGNVGRLSALNNFTGKFLGQKDLLIHPPDSEQSNKQVLSKEESAYASLWDLWMPHFMAIYEAGPGFYNGLHGLPTLSSGRRLWEGLLGSPASYGCIILGLEEAEILYHWAEVGVVAVVE